MKIKQKNRLISFTTPLGEDELHVYKFHGTEYLSDLFTFHLSIVSNNHQIDFSEIIGKQVTVSIALPHGNKRYINGLIRSFAQVKGGGIKGGNPRFAFYSAEMVPQCYLLTKTKNSRIFQKLSAPDIIEQIFSDHTFFDYKFMIQKSDYLKREYCVQYQESDFNFVCRLLEEEGIYYYFEHVSDKHTLIMADAPDKHRPCPYQETAQYQIITGGIYSEDIITGFSKRQDIVPAAISLKDFNFQMPSVDMSANISSNNKLGPEKRELFEYPGKFEKRDQGNRFANIRMEEQETLITKINGTSFCRAFTSGYRFRIRKYYRDDMDQKEYVLTSITHNVDLEGELPGSLERIDSITQHYTNIFTCIPFEIPFRPERKTKKPLIHGTQTAIVVGPQGEEIYTDENGYGQVKVQFHWDREGKYNESSSCWIRVSQMWAGNSWGAFQLPRVGQEVIVSFLNGDPDRPIITGRLYHADNRQAYPLPDSKTISYIKSNSYPGGGGSNEIRFEDKNGEEEFFTHAQKDQNESIENNMSTTVGADQTITVGQNRTKQVDGNETNSTKGNLTVSVDGTHTETIKQNTTISISDGSYSHDVASSTATYHVSGSVVENYDDKQTTTVANDISITSDNSKISIKAATEILLETGSSSIKMKSDGTIIIEGVDIAINGTSITIHGASVTSIADADHNTSGNIVVSNGKAVNTVQGGMVMLNP